ncbi:hypothetical protein RchiOBHm_Chr2g0120431 [Rosa chinensis]|uniref:Uncharacterized protein n=1 Tax=Rosa chinensis TaxID=74649 RepID=A0A2P6RSB0_ROSCH|nr:hypothetical protein RchiOBHm_Chr2g0120431 [Rosa chinensis]
MRRRVKGLVLRAQARIFLAWINSGISFLESDWIDQLRNMMADGGEGSGGDIQGGEGEGEEEEVGARWRRRRRRRRWRSRPRRRPRWWRRRRTRGRRRVEREVWIMSFLISKI